MNEVELLIRQWVRRAKAFEENVHSILGIHESSPSRIVLLDDTYKKLTTLNIIQDDLFRQALRCTENVLYRAAHVMAWAAFMDFLEDKICEDGLIKLKTVRPKWKANNKEELRESINEFQIVDVTRDLGICTKTQGKALHGLLNKRNECAHPSNFFPGLNETLGYLTELLTRINQIKPKHV